MLTIEAVPTPIPIADTRSVPIFEEVQSVDFVLAGIATAEQASGLIPDGLRDELEVLSAAIGDVDTTCRESGCSPVRTGGEGKHEAIKRTVPVAGDILSDGVHGAGIWVGITARRCMVVSMIAHLRGREYAEERKRTGKHWMYRPRHCSKCQDRPEPDSQKGWRRRWCHNECRPQRMRMGGYWLRAQ